jgi:hypothetical protein
LRIFGSTGGGGGPGSDTGLRVTVGLEEMYIAAYTTKYTEFSYTGDDLTTIEVWNEVAKTTKLFTWGILVMIYLLLLRLLHRNLVYFESTPACKDTKWRLKLYTL